MHNPSTEIFDHGRLSYNHEKKHPSPSPFLQLLSSAKPPSPYSHNPTPKELILLCSWGPHSPCPKAVVLLLVILPRSRLTGLEFPGLTPEKLLLAPLLSRRRLPNFMVNMPSIS